MRLNKRSFRGLLKAVGSIDAYISVADYYDELQNKSNSLCFVKLERKRAPHIRLHEMWNVMLDPDKAVPSNFELGREGGVRNAIFSGPNMGGKSTLLKGIIMSIIFAQAFGLAPAKAMTLTPFAQINTHMNTVDDTLEGKSLYQAEVEHAQQFIRSIEELPHGDFAFSIIDELFNGTNSAEGGAGAYGVGRRLATIDHSMSIMATHFDIIHSLETDTNNFKNFKVKAHVSDTDITFPYKLYPGASNQKIALQILKNNNFASDIVDHAYDAFSHPERHQPSSQLYIDGDEPVQLKD